MLIIIQLKEMKFKLTVNFTKKIVQEILKHKISYKIKNQNL